MDKVLQRKEQARRLDNVLSLLNVKPTEFFRNLPDYNATGTSIMRQMRDGQQGISPKMMRNIQKAYPKINPEYLKTGTMPVLIDSEVKMFRSANIPSGKPYYTLNGMSPNLASMHNWKSDSSLTIHIPMMDCDFYCEVAFETMYPRLKKGDIIACKSIKDFDSIVYGRVYYIFTAEDSFLYRVQKSTVKDELKLVSENPKFDDYTVKRSSIKQVLQVTGFISQSL